KLGAFKISMVEIMVVLMIVGFILRIRSQSTDLALTGIDKLFLCLICWSLFSVHRAQNPIKTWQEVALLVESFLIFYMVSHGLTKEDNKMVLLRSWCSGAVIVAALGILQFILMLKTGQSFYGLDHGFLSHGLRINSTFSHANSLSGYLIMFIPVLLAFSYKTTSNKRTFWLVSSAIVITALVVTYTRTGWAATILALLLLIMLLKDKRLLIGLLACTILASFMFPQVINRVESLLRPGTDLASLQRFQLWEAAYFMWRDNPIAGVGTGNFYNLLMTYAHRYPDLKQIFEPLEPHSSFIKFLAESGIVGLVLFIALISQIVRRAIKVYILESETVHKIIFAGILSGGVAFLLQSNTNSLFHDPRVAVVFWMLAGLAAAENDKGKSVAEHRYPKAIPVVTGENVVEI
ncbi:MAG TPA: O-antigen ligase family protein, partial [Desulfobacteria bacterium]|nr:O-antigen ligase family protein [Desulfobacteria bacterium]